MIYILNINGEKKLNFKHFRYFLKFSQMKNWKFISFNIISSHTTVFNRFLSLYNLGQNCGATVEQYHSFVPYGSCTVTIRFNERVDSTVGCYMLVINATILLYTKIVEKLNVSKFWYINPNYFKFVNNLNN